VKPFGPDALEDLMLERIMKISCLDGMAHRAKFSSVEMELSNKFNKLLLITCKEDENKELK
jgi:hypothetical protein